MSDSDVDITRTLTKVTYLGLLMNVLAPVAYVGIAIYFRERNQGGDLPDGFAVAANLKILFFIFLAVSCLDLGLAYYFRSRLPGNVMLPRRQRGRLLALSLEEHFNRVAVNLSMVIFACTAAASVYGLVLIVMGAQLEVMVLFVALSLIGYQFFRPREAFLERVLERVRQIRAEAGKTG